MANNSRNLPIKARVEPEVKTEIFATAEDYNTDASTVIRQLLLVWMGKPGARMPDGPWQDEAAPGPVPVAFG